MMDFTNKKAVEFSRIRMLLTFAKIAALVFFFVLVAKLYGLF